jgi:hypothetical protein
MIAAANGGSLRICRDLQNDETGDCEECAALNEARRPRLTPWSADRAVDR